MSRPLSPIFCDGPGCTKRKQESNRWWTIGLNEDPEIDGLLTLFPGTLPMSEHGFDSVYDFCGQTCALKWVSEQMGKVTS
jgi:hypothetical protein